MKKILIALLALALLAPIMAKKKKKHSKKKITDPCLLALKSCLKGTKPFYKEAKKMYKTCKKKKTSSKECEKARQDFAKSLDAHNDSCHEEGGFYQGGCYPVYNESSSGH